MSEERVRIEIADGVAQARLVRGDKHNGLDAAMFARLVEAARELGDDPSVRAVVLSGDGPSFCAGLDFKAVMGGTGLTPDLAFAREDGDFANHAQRAAYDWHRLPVPVIAALHGNCLGGGLQIALAADIRIAAPNTRLSVMEIRYGLIPDMSLTTTLPDLVGIDVAKELVWTGRTVDAEEALELGLVTRVDDDPQGVALELAREIATKSPDAIRRGKRLLNEAWRAPADRSLPLEAELQQELMGSPNQIAAVQAALSGEPAKFSDPA
ncbi:MAG TPA: crotonase/enoyl-CoA hydratase family protein [Solirubrobacterales bacterium]|nr:crotonase/enoyl-CoA hydratase family protein [Solirubrobacterales bacterium]